jgi:hypothetical protein
MLHQFLVDARCLTQEWSQLELAPLGLYQPEVRGLLSRPQFTERASGLLDAMLVLPYLLLKPLSLVVDLPLRFDQLLGLEHHAPQPPELATL